MLKNIFENDYVQYMIVGFAALAVIAIIGYFEPLILLLAMGFTFFVLVSLAVGYVIVDSYKMWREDDDKNTSRKKTPSSKDVTKG